MCPMEGIALHTVNPLVIALIIQSDKMYKAVQYIQYCSSHLVLQKDTPECITWLPLSNALQPSKQFIFLSRDDGKILFSKRATLSLDTQKP